MSSRAEKTRLDTLLVERGLFPSRSKAAASIMAGEVFVGSGRSRAGKPGQFVPIDIELEIEGGTRFVSRGGVKLENAINTLEIECEGRRALDVGASTGGFSDCLLQAGVAELVSLDVAYGELAWKIREDARVHVLERINAKLLSAEMLPFPPDLVVCDVSFIGLSKVLPAIFGVVTPRFDIVALVKPQFEVGRADVGKGGVVRDAAVRRRALVDVGEFCVRSGQGVGGFASSGLPGPKGNLETFIHICEASRAGRIDNIEEGARLIEP